MIGQQTQIEKRIWNEAKDLHEFHFTDLVQFGVSQNTARQYMRKWERWGWIRVVRVEKRQRYFADSSKPIQTIEPVSDKPTPEGNMWRAMRGLSQFSPTDVAAHANAGGIEVTVDRARSYCRQLMAAGFLRVRVQAAPGRREALYQLIENTGPRAPRSTRLQGLLDPNTNAFHPADRRIKT